MALRQKIRELKVKNLKSSSKKVGHGTAPSVLASNGSDKRKSTDIDGMLYTRGCKLCLAD